MKPVEFKESNIVLTKPNNMTDEECSSLDVFTNGEQCISSWKGSLFERIKFLLTGKMWVSLYSGRSQPPVWVGTKYPFQGVND